MNSHFNTIIKNTFLKLIKTYQAMPLHTHTQCRYLPTCSEYTYQAIQKYGILKGSFLGLKRILNCHPFSHHGHKPLK